MKQGLVIFDDFRCDLHNTGPSLPENGQRTAAVREVLYKYDVISDWPMIPMDHPALLSVHAKRYVDQVQGWCKEDEYRFAGSDVVLYGNDSLNAIRLAAGAGIAALRHERAFCSIRPPGHHAQYGKAGGYCIFNNVAIAAQHALMTEPNVKIAIVDWDVHHGNGTQDYIFRNGEYAKRLMFINTQQDYKDFYPGSGKPAHAAGQHKNVYSFNLNKGDGDEEMKHLFETQLVPLLNDFAPTLIIVSCGFDAHTLDPLSELQLSSQMYGWMTEQLLRVCPRMISMLEGGYSTVALKDGVKAHLKAMKKYSH
jgi:acetoin utilization deacetylase AcuC-like enzyme